MLSVFVVVFSIIVIIVWLICHRIVKARLTDLQSTLPAFYQAAVAAPVYLDTQPALMALCVDLCRKEYCTIPFDQLTEKEQRLVLLTRAIEVLPTWMSRFGALSLWPADRAMITRLRDVHTSRPVKKPLYFSAIKNQQQLRSRPET